MTTMLRDHQRALRAYACVEASGRSGTAFQAYRSFVLDLPLAIRRRGLGVVIADLDHRRRGADPKSSKRTDQQTAAAWVMDDLVAVGLQPWHSGGDLSSVEQLRTGVFKASGVEYTALAYEALRVASWLKRAVESQPKAGAGSEPQGEAG